MIVNSQNIEFGYELISVLPYAYYLHCAGQLEKTISGNDTESLYYFSPDHEINPAQRSWYNTNKVKAPNLNIHRPHLNKNEFAIPPYREHFANDELKFDKETVVICNRHNVEWSTKPINFFDLDTLKELFELLQDKYQIVYINVEGRKELYDNAPPVPFGDFELLKKYPKIINFHDLVKDSWNETQLKVFANCEKFITMNGGHAILAAFFGGENIIMSKYGEPQTREINKNVNSFYRWYHEFSGQRIVHVENEKRLLKQVKSQWVDKDPVINILVRTSGRPNYFKECFNSIKEQDYPNINIWVSIDSDDKYTFSYPVYPIEIKRKTDFDLRKEYDYLGKILPYNLYFNEMHDRVKDGLIMYLDDDDQFCDNKAVSRIVKEHKKGNDLIFWQVKVGSKLMPPLELWKKKPELFNISGIGYAFDSKYKDVAVWHPFKRSDFRVATALYEGIKNQGWIKRLLTRTQNGSHSGIRIDKEIINGKLKKMERKIKIKIIKDTHNGRKLKRKIGEVVELADYMAIHLCKHGIAEEVVNKPPNKAEKFKTQDIKTGKVVISKPTLGQKPKSKTKK